MNPGTTNHLLSDETGGFFFYEHAGGDRHPVG